MHATLTVARWFAGKRSVNGVLGLPGQSSHITLTQLKDLVLETQDTK